VAAGAIAPGDSVLLDAVRSIRWPARKKSPAGPAGAHLSNMLGGSAEFTEYRSYRQGDETRRIDWKLLARSNRAYIRLSNDRTIVSTMLLVDASASLAYPADSLEKWSYARQLVLGLASAAHAGGDPVGLTVVTGDGSRRVPPRTRRGAVYDIARVLDDVAPAGTSQLATVLPTLRSAGRIAIVSDFLGESEALLRMASHLTAAGKEVHAIHVIHADELDPPKRATLLTDPEDISVRRPVTRETRREYLERFGEWREQLARDWRMAGAYYFACATTEPAARAVRRIAEARGG
jgi:uncharacterized protein (DUF58 family)